MPSNHTSVYMRGLYDGFQIGTQQEMTPKKFKLTLDGQTSICKKIFEFVPKTEAWTAQAIVTAMSRNGGTRPDMKTAEGCLNSLKDSGLIKETERGLFQAVVPRESITLAGSTSDAPSEQASGLGDIHVSIPITCEAEPPRTPAAQFGDIATGLRLKGQSLIRLADEIDSAALAFEQEIEDANKRLERFNQLKALLAS
jgi:hypothetical protein